LKNMTPVLFASVVGVQQIVCWGTLTYAAAIFAPHLAQVCGISIAQVMTCYGLGLLANALTAPWLTRWVLRVGSFWPALAGLGLLMTACLTLSQATHTAILILGFVLSGMAMGLTQYDFAFLTVKLHMPGHARRTITLITFYGALASTIMWPVALALSSRLGPAHAWIGLGLICLMASLPAVCLAYRLPMLPEPQPCALTAPSSAEPQTPSARWVLWSLIGFMLIGTSLVANMPLVLSQLAISARDLGWTLSLFGIGQLSARALDYAAGRWLSMRATIVASMVCITAALALMIGAHGHSALAAAFVFLLGAGNGLVTILRGVLPQQLFSGHAFAQVSSRLASLGALTRALMPVVVAHALVGSAGVLSLSLGFGLLALACGWMLLRQSKHHTA
jgi:predicted MFS family arabinose efflux permease